MKTSTRDLLFLSGKACLACLATLVIDDWVGNPDHVSSTFVAVLSVAAVALVGLRQGVAQFVGSVLGGAWGTLALFAGVPALAGVPLAVGLAILTAYVARAADGYPVAAFTALYLILVPQGGPLETYGIRLLAVGCGAVGGLLVNLAVSSLFYRQIYTRRMSDAEGMTWSLLADALRRGSHAAEGGFALLAQLQADLSHAMTELRWRGAETAHASVRKMWWRVEELRSLLHLACNLGHVVSQEGIEEAALDPLIEWLEAPAGPAPAVADGLQQPVRRLEMAVLALKSGPGRAA